MGQLLVKGKLVPYLPLQSFYRTFGRLRVRPVMAGFPAEVRAIWVWHTALFSLSLSVLLADIVGS
jgi:hypothetical protein